jgi:protein phosphatase
MPDFETARRFLEIGSESVTGARSENQDRLTHFESPFGHVFVVADGMGGHRGGAVASSLAISRLPEILRSLPANLAPQGALADAIWILNRTIREEARNGGDSLSGMGSTLAVVLVRETPDGSLAIGAHVGDSRIYYLRGAQLFRLTRDHTVVEQLIAGGALTSEQGIDHPQAGMLTRALGQVDGVEADLTSWTLLRPGDVFMLCSDGLWGYVAENEIREILLAQTESPNAIACRLVERALAKESRDNVSVLIFRVAEA